NAASLTRALARRSHRPRTMDLKVIRAQQSIADRFYALGLINKPVSVREAVWYGEATNSDLGLLMHVD
ncbi:AAA family ATPase, partial [Klebsiella oxytoca]